MSLATGWGSSEEPNWGLHLPWSCRLAHRLPGKEPFFQLISVSCWEMGCEAELSRSGHLREGGVNSKGGQGTVGTLFSQVDSDCKDKD